MDIRYFRFYMSYHSGRDLTFSLSNHLSSFIYLFVRLIDDVIQVIMHVLLDKMRIDNWYFRNTWSCCNCQF